jgi:clan AA aspartic protease
MITGIVTVDREAIIRITIQGPSGQQIDIDATIDTGYDGTLTLTPALIGQLALTSQRRGRAILGDGTTCDFDIYQSEVIWDGQALPMIVDEADTMPLVGMAMMEDYELTIQGRPQVQVTISALP